MDRRSHFSGSFGNVGQAVGQSFVANRANTASMSCSALADNVGDANESIDVGLVHVDELDGTQPKVIPKSPAKPVVVGPFGLWPASCDFACITTAPNPNVITDMTDDLWTD